MYDPFDETGLAYHPSRSLSRREKRALAVCAALALVGLALGLRAAL